uniref:Speckle-type POZ protein-like (inferred by orthology to a human protein) n=1 Tax=Strongyloides venezuelensis TaxID=75913 RepID=A0A0K0G572_STRVS
MTNILQVEINLSNILVLLSLEEKLVWFFENIVSYASYNIESKVNKFNYICSIPNFSLCSEKTGEKIISPTFVIGRKERSELCLWVYPNGDQEDSKEYVSVFLALLKPDKTKIKHRFSILNDMGEEKI